MPANLALMLNSRYAFKSFGSESKGEDTKRLVQLPVFTVPLCVAWWNLFKNEGKKALKNKKRGRPIGSCRKLSPEQEKEIQKAILR